MRLTRYVTALFAAMALGCAGRSVTTPGAGAEPSHPALWSKRIGPGWVSGVAYDPAGNVVVAGTIQGDFDASLGGGAGDRTRADGFVAEFDHAGNVVWLHRWANPGGMAVAMPALATMALAVTVNEKGVSVLGLGWTGVVDLGGGSVSLPQNPQGTRSPFIAHYSAAGTFASAASLASSLCQTSYCNPPWMAFDDAGSAYSLTAVSSLSSPPQGETVLTKSDSDGTSLWSVSLPSGSPDSGMAVSGSGTIALFAPFGMTIFGPDGAQRWSRQFHWANPVGPVAFDGAGNILVGGTFAGEIDLGGPAPLQSPAGDSQQPGDKQAQPMFLAKYDASGNYLWGHAYGSTPRAQSKVGAIVVAPNQDVIFAGGFAGEVDFGTAAFQTSSDAEEVGLHDAFLARLGADGAGRWSDGFGGGGLDDTGTCLAIAPDGRVAMGGAFDRTIDFGNGPFASVGMFGSQWGPGADGFLAVFGP